MKREEVKSIFTLSGFEVLAMKELIDGYGYKSDDPRFFGSYPRTVWWFVKTSFGWIEIGWRKRVIAIDWTDTGIKAAVTEDDVTKDEFKVHAYSFTKAVEYLAKLKAIGDSQ